MSIVIANNDEKGFYIISDTKLTLDEDKMPCQIKEPLRTNLKKYGIIKTIIIRRDIAISFAGNDIRIADEIIKDLRGRIYSPNMGIDYTELEEIVRNKFENEKNLNADGTHKCDFILSFLNGDEIKLIQFNDYGIREIKKGYIGNSEVYKRFVDYDLEKLPDLSYSKSNTIPVEVSVNIKFTPLGDEEQDTEEMKSKIQRLKEIVDLGIKSDIYHSTDVGSPVIGVYYNTQRKQFEYFYDMIFEVHREIPKDGCVYPVNINLYHSGESYTIKPFQYNQGIIIYYPFLRKSIIYLCTIDYMQLGIDDYNNLLLPLEREYPFDENNIKAVK